MGETETMSSERDDRLPEFIPAAGLVWVIEPDGEGATPVIGWVSDGPGDGYSPVSIYGVHELEIRFYETKKEAESQASFDKVTRRRAAS